MIIVIMIAIVEDITRSKGTASNINNSKTTATTIAFVVDMPHLLRTAFPARNISNGEERWCVGGELKRSRPLT
jgi:hypothetical protein